MRIFSDEHKHNLSLAAMGRVHTNETKIKLSLAHMGKKLSIEQKKKMSIAHVGKIFSNLHRENISNAQKGKHKTVSTNFTMRGKHHSIETKCKLSLAHKGKVLSKETREKISAAHKGMKLSDTHRMSLSESHVGKPGHACSEENKRRLSKLRKGVPLSDEHKRKLSAWIRGEGMRRKISKWAASFVKGYKGNYRVNYKGISMRSSWEVKVAEWLDLKGILWEYEPMIFEFEGRRYLPDFKLIDSGEFIEVKGWLKQDDVVKMNAFVAAGYKLYFVGKKEIDRDEKLVRCWYGPKGC